MPERLYIGHAADLPHAADRGRTKCGRQLTGMVAVTATQALVYLGDARCARCFPQWAFRQGAHRWES